MENITTSSELKEAIQLLEFEHTYKGQVLKEQLLLSGESLKPANLIKNAFSEVVSSPYLMDNILGATVGLASGYISKVIAVGSSENKFKKLLGTILQFGVTNLVAQHTDTLKTVGQFIYQHFIQRKETNDRIQ
jgi:hypothetical protein